MALFGDDQGKTEKATPGRLNEARQKGQVARSRELNMAGTLLIASLAMEYFGSWLIDAFRELFERGFRVESATHRLADGDLTGAVSTLTDFGLVVLAPLGFFFSVFFAATALFGYGQIGGIKLAPKALGIKFEKLNPVTNLGQLLKLSQLVKAGISLGKLLILGGVLYWIVMDEWQTLANLHEQPTLTASLALIAKMAFRVFFWVSLIVFLLAIVDVFWQRHEFAEKMKMTKQEVEDERKREDGDPFVKNRLKGARLKLMQQRMMDTVPTADVIITNPTHFSVALRYDRKKNGAPELIAKGMDDLALRIRELAREHDIPLMEDPPLARALFRAVDVGQEVPERFYQAVAAVLGHVYRLRNQVA